MSFIENHGQLRQREPRVRDKRHLGFVARLPCLCCLIRRGATVRPVQVAHIRAGYPGMPGWRDVGRSEKPHDWRTAPLCVSCHLDGPDAQHKSLERDWWQALGVYPPDFCSALVRAFAAGQDGMAVIRHFVAAAPLERARTGCP